jgi:antitoxin component YwqK of YwqJK toxin-antitoxin module
LIKKGQFFASKLLAKFLNKNNNGMKNFVSWLLMIIILTGPLLSVQIFSQNTGFDPFKLEAKYFDDSNVKNEKIFIDKGTSYKIINTKYEKGLKIIDDKNKELWHGVVFFYSGDKISQQITYRFGVRNGEYKSFYLSNRGIFIIRSYSDNKIEGVEYEYFDQGAIKAETTYSNDLKDGIRKTYYSPDKGEKQGPLFSTSSYSKGIPEGEIVEYYRDGRVYSRRKNQ